MKKTSPLAIILFAFFALGIILSLSLTSALVASISNPKMVLYKNMTSGENLVFENSVVVNNENNFSVNILVQPTNAFGEMVVIKESNFTLVPGERKEVFYEMTFKQPGDYAGDILVTFSSEAIENSLSISQRVVVWVYGDKPINFVTILLIVSTLVLLIFLIALYLGYKKFRLNKNKHSLK